MKKVGRIVITLIIILVGLISPLFSIYADVTGFDYTNYYELNYIQSSGTQYINTGIVNNFYKHEYKFRLLTLPSENTVYIGSSVTNRSHPLLVNSVGNVGYALGGTNRLSGTNITIDTDHIVVAQLFNGNQSFTLDGSTLISRTDSINYAFASNIGVFSTNQNGTFIAAPSMRLYYYRIYDTNDDLVAEFIPAERKSDGVLGLYDTVSNSFKTNSGSGTFTSGGRLVTQYTITTNVSPSGSGTVSGGGTYDSGTTVTLIATPNSGYTFDSWSSGETTSSISVVASSNLTYTAYFIQEDTPSPTQYTITTNVSPSGSGTVSGGGTYDSGTTVTLTATPNNGYTFERWNTGSTNSSISVNVTSNASYTAYFVEEETPTPTQYTITTNVSPSGSGTVSGGGTYDSGTTVTLTATANSGYTFSTWSDGITANPRQVTLTGNLNLTANFTQNASPTDIIIGANVYLIDYEREVYLQSTHDNTNSLGYARVSPIGGDAYWVYYDLETVTDTTYLYQIDFVLNDDYIGYLVIGSGQISTYNRKVYVNGNHCTTTYIGNANVNSIDLSVNTSHLTKKTKVEDLLEDGNADSQESVSQFESQLDSFNDTSDQYQSLESDINDDFNSSMNNIDTTNNGLAAMGSNFQNSAIWVTRQFNKFTATTPFGSLLGFSLVLGVSLLIIGRIFK